MKTFSYKITDEVGIHARPAGTLARMAGKYNSVVTIEKNGTSVNLEKLIAVMQLNVMYGETVTVTTDGTDEEDAFDEIKAFFEENL